MDLINFSESSVVKGLLFSSHGKYGPQAKYMFPKEVSIQECEEFKKQNIQKLTLRDYMHMAIKNLSLFLSDLNFTDYKERFQDIHHFGIIPFPDFKLTALTYFNYTKIKSEPEPSTLSILVDENRRNFLYNHIDRFKPIVLSFFNEFNDKISSGSKNQEELAPVFNKLFQKLLEIEKKPYATITSKRKMKILMCGLDDAGKSSFLLSVDRKYSKLIGLKPTLGAEVSSMEAFGSSIFLWDLGGQQSSREKYINKAHIYLFETDLLFFFIDIKDPERFEESIEYLQTLKLNLNQFKQDPPIIYIFSKGDSDILESDEIQNNIELLTSKLKEITPNKEPEIFITSIFSIYSILRAFSTGISKLSPNRELINFNLKNFANRTGINLALLLNNEGLILADYYSSDEITLKEPTLPSELSELFSITAPQFAMLYKIFSKFKVLDKEEALFNIANSVILLKKFQIADYEMFLLFLMDESIKRNKIEELFPNFIYRTSDLLLGYIS